MAICTKTQGTKLQLGSVASPQTFTDLAAVVGITGLNSGSATEISCTNLDSTFTEFVRGLGDGGSVSAELNWDYDQTTHQTLWDLNEEGTTRQWRVVDVSGNYYEFNAFISSMGIDFSADSIVKASVTLRVTGRPNAVAA